MGTLQRPELFDIYLRPGDRVWALLRVVRTGHGTPSWAFLARAVCEAGAVFSDHMRFVPGVGSRSMFERDLTTLRPGVTELHLHPAVESAELVSLATDDWRGGERLRDDLQRGWVRDALDAAGAKLIGFRPLLRVGPRRGLRANPAR